jgi:hypothetical protein
MGASRRGDLAHPANVVLGALTDFSPRRPELWPNISPRLYQVHSVGTLRPR